MHLEDFGLLTSYLCHALHTPIVIVEVEEFADKYRLSVRLFPKCTPKSYAFCWSRWHNCSKKRNKSMIFDADVAVDVVHLFEN